MTRMLIALGAAAMLGVAACSDGGGGPTEPEDPGGAGGGPPVSPPPVLSIERVSGDGQTGNAGESLALPFVIRVTDASGAGVGSVAVTWVVTDGRALLRPREGPGWGTAVTIRTDPGGAAGVRLHAASIGRIEVIVTADRVWHEPVSFAALTTGQVISNGLSWWGDFSDVAVPTGTPVEWVNEQPATLRIRSITAPPGGDAFAMTLEQGERFHLAADVPGNWEWAWSYLSDERFAGVAILSVGTEPAELSALGVATSVSFGYRARYDEHIPRPAFANHPATMTCAEGGHLTTTAYLPSDRPTARRLLVMYRTRDGREAVMTHGGSAAYETVRHVIPAGRFRVLTVLAAHEATIGPESAQLLEEAQAAINQAHADFARSRGYASPIVQFDFTNMVIPGDDSWDPRTLYGVSRALIAHEMTVAGYDFVVVVNPDPARVEGARAILTSAAPHFVYLGNHGSWKTRLKAADFTSIAAAAYHREIAHHWGWQENWTPRCSQDWPHGPFVTDPALFGWEDTDGDGVAEILDPTPYGRP